MKVTCSLLLATMALLSSAPTSNAAYLGKMHAKRSHTTDAMEVFAFAKGGCSRAGTSGSTVTFTSSRQQYTIPRDGVCLGAGTFGEAYIATMGGKQYALKLQEPRNASNREEMEKEERIAILMQSEHVPNAVKIESVGTCEWTRVNPKTLIQERKTGRCIAMELLTGGSLSDYLRANRNMDVRAALKVTRQLALELDAMHDRVKMIHSDFKPANIMLKMPAGCDVTPTKANIDDHCTPIPVLIDFGLATRIGSSYDRCTSGFRGPETYEAGAKATGKNDVFSLGVVLLSLVDSDDALRRHCWSSEDKYWSPECYNAKSWSEASRLPGPIRALFDQMVDGDLSKRLSARGVADEIDRILDEDYLEPLPDRVSKHITVWRKRMDGIAQSYNVLPQNVREGDVVMGDSTLVFSGGRWKRAENIREAPAAPAREAREVRVPAAVHGAMRGADQAVGMGRGPGGAKRY